MEIHAKNPHNENSNPDYNPTPNTSPRVEEIYISHPKIPYVVCHMEFITFRRITRAYARQRRALPITLLLPRRTRTMRLIVSTIENTFVHMIKDKVYFSLIEIENPFGFIHNTQIVTPPTITYSELKEDPK